jgi:hypothetical protein
VSGSTLLGLAFCCCGFLLLWIFSSSYSASFSLHLSTTHFLFSFQLFNFFYNLFSSISVSLSILSTTHLFFFFFFNCLIFFILKYLISLNCVGMGFGNATICLILFLYVDGQRTNRDLQERIVKSFAHETIILDN